MKLSKQEAKEKISKFFQDIQDKNPKDIQKIRKLALSYNIRLGDLKKKFCKKCFTVYTGKNSFTRIKNKIKIVKCKKCGYINRWKIRD